MILKGRIKQIFFFVKCFWDLCTKASEWEQVWLVSHFRNWERGTASTWLFSSQRKSTVKMEKKWSFSLSIQLLYNTLHWRLVGKSPTFTKLSWWRLETSLIVPKSSTISDLKKKKKNQLPAWLLAINSCTAIPSQFHSYTITTWRLITSKKLYQSALSARPIVK